MDVIKKQWNNVVRYQFWILSVCVLIAAATVFYLTSSGLSAQVAARTVKLNSTFEQVSKISSSLPTHANSYSHAVLDKSALELEKDIKKAWERQYNYQIPLMVWPRDAFFDASTHSIFSTLRPVEKYIDFPLPPRLPAPYDKITLNDRQVYKQYIGPEFASVSRKMGTEWKAQLTQVASADASNIANLTTDVVRWSKESQQTLLQQIVPWYNKGQAPSILDIYYTQEDMWLLSGIMEIIKKANGDSRENFQTVVREVEFIRMGQFASRNAGTLTPFASATGGFGMGNGGMSGGGEEGSMGSGGMSSGGGGEMGGGEMGSGGMGSGEGSSAGGDPANAVDPADNRYISFATETDFQPRKGAELRESIRTVSAANAVDAVAKRVAIRMRLKIDPSGLSRLITACGNADLLLEVYQVRVNTEAATATGSVGGGFGGGGMGGPGGGMGGGMGGPGGGKGGMSSGGMGMGMGMGMGGGSDDGYGGEGSSSSGGGGGYGSAAAVVEDASAEISVEIFGLIYLYNPDNIVSLGTDLAPEKLETTPSTSAVADPPATAPAATDATGNTPRVSNDPSDPATPAGESPVGPEAPAVPPNVGDGVSPPIGTN